MKYFKNAGRFDAAEGVLEGLYKKYTTEEDPSDIEGSTMAGEKIVNDFINGLIGDVIEYLPEYIDEILVFSDKTVLDRDDQFALIEAVKHATFKRLVSEEGLRSVLGEYINSPEILLADGQ
jgi:hypothetical protein